MKSEIYMEIKEQVKERVDARPLLNTSGLTPGTPGAADYGASLLTSNMNSYTSVESAPITTSFTQSTAGYQTGYQK